MPTAIYRESVIQAVKLRILGSYFGYPDCCIDAFVTDCKNGTYPGNRRPPGNSGFIPCPECHQKLQSKQATLSSLIRGRKSSLSFPQENPEETAKYLDATFRKLLNCSNPR